jgi:hypothetical protein
MEAYNRKYKKYKTNETVSNRKKISPLTSKVGAMQLKQLRKTVISQKTH